MRSRNVLHPNTLIAFALKICLALLLLSVVKSLVFQELSNPLSGFGSIGTVVAGLIGLALLSLAAYAILKHRLRKWLPQPSARSHAERTPVLPPWEEEP